MPAESPLYPFTLRSLLNLPTLVLEPPSTWQGFRFEENLQNIVFHLPDVDDKSLSSFELGAFKLDGQDVPLPTLESSAASSVGTGGDESVQEEHVHENNYGDWENDIWQLPEVSNARKQANLTSWDHFVNDEHIEPHTVYLTEAGAQTFDAVLERVSKSDSPTRVVAADKFLSALLELGQGRSSTYFAWCEDKEEFIPSFQNFTVSGYSSDAISAVVTSIASVGSQMNSLAQNYDRSRQNSHQFLPCQIAFYAAANSCATAIRQHLESQRPQALSLLRIQDHYESPKALLVMLSGLVTVVERATNDCVLISNLTRTACHLALVYPVFESVLCEILSTCASTLIDRLGREIGLEQSSLPSNSDIALQQGADQSETWSTLLSPENSQMADEASHSLALLRENAPELVPTGYGHLKQPGFALAYSWDAIEVLQTTAIEYEQNFKSSILIKKARREHQSQSNKPATDGLSFTADFSSKKASESIQFDLMGLETELSRISAQDKICGVVSRCLASVTPPDLYLQLDCQQAVDVSIQPLLSAQHRLLSFSVIDLLFRNYKLLQHIRLQRRFQLFGSGTFVAQLSTSLYDSGQYSGEGRRRTGATTGLRLQTRDTWPPASSELRLVLMGILSDSLSNSEIHFLEEFISFAIRDLNDEELEQCRDANSIHALDFLRIQYRPPNPIVEAVVGAESLDKYDRIFQHLLRLLRVQNVTQSLLRDVCPRRQSHTYRSDHRFRVEMHRFTSTLADYCQNIAIELPWSKLERAFCLIERQIESKDYEGTLQSGKSLTNLREMHLKTLDEMLRALLLKRKQAAARGAIEQIFGIVLQFAAFIRRSKATSDIDNDMTTKRFHEEFRAQVRKLLGLLQSAADGNEDNKAGGVEEINVFEDLLLRLDMFEYWAKT